MSVRSNLVLVRFLTPEFLRIKRPMRKGDGHVMYIECDSLIFMYNFEMYSNLKDCCRRGAKTRSGLAMGAKFSI